MMATSNLSSPHVVSHEEWCAAADLVDLEASSCRERPRPGAGDLLSLAASPTFAIMALLAGLQGNTMPEMHDASPLTGMALMYGLMSVFHAAPWLKLAKAAFAW
jgi:hypothetical protein